MIWKVKQFFEFNMQLLLNQRIFIGSMKLSKLYNEIILIYDKHLTLIISFIT